MTDKVIGEGMSAYEPDPIKNDNPSIHDLVKKDFENSSEFSDRNLVLSCKKDIEDRKQFGLKKYGTVLQADNGRDPLLDAYQEVHDLVVYLKQWLVENEQDQFIDEVGPYSEADPLSIYWSVNELYKRSVLDLFSLRDIINLAPLTKELRTHNRLQATSF